MKEEWRPVIGYEGLYEVSNLGNVRSLCAGRWKTRMDRKPVPDKDGYLTVNIKKNGKYKCAKIHRIVAEAFIPNPNNYPAINHMDEDKTNNRFDNLEWCTNKYNNNYHGKAQRCNKPVIQLTVDGVEIARFGSVNDAAKALNTNPANISAALHGVHKTMGGYVWLFQSF